MPLELKKVTPVELRSVGLDEKWLQNQIMLDSSLLAWESWTSSDANIANLSAVDYF